MPAADSSDPKPVVAAPGSIEDYLAPLAAAAPERPGGRIRSLREARSALGIPTSAAPEVLRVWGVPADGQLAAWPVSDPDHPGLVAEFAVLRVIRRQGRELVPATRRTRLRLREKSNLLWVVYGSIVSAVGGTLVLEGLGIGPAFEGQLSHKDDEIARGITGQLLRLLSPPRLLQDTVERLERDRYRLAKAEQRGAPPMPEAQRDVYDQIAAGRPRQTRLSDDQLEAIAKRYIVLCRRGLNHPLPQLAREFGISRTQARDRIHKARRQRYLKPAQRGRVNPEPGPKLKGWTPPATALNRQLTGDDSPRPTPTLE